jgi:leucyl-tRNA synthetase
MILGEDGEKMSKSRGNVVNPDDVVHDYGADTMRLYEMFIGDFEKAAPWSTNGVKGCKRFLDRFAVLSDMIKDNEDKELERELHRTIKKVTNDIEDMKFNTAIAAMMSLTNEIYAKGGINREGLKLFTVILCPFAPHICEELWETLGGEGLCSLAEWPRYDEEKIKVDEVEIAVQICGKVKATVTVPADCDEQTAFEIIESSGEVTSYTEGKSIVKKIYVPNRIFNIVVK